MSLNKRFSALLAFATPVLGLTLFFAVGGCSIKSETQSCTYNGRPVDCSQMPGQSAQPDVGTPDSKTSAPAPMPGSGVATRFACDSLTCSSNAQFCLKSVTSSGMTATSECAPLKSGDDCSSLPAAAKARFATSNNCGGFITCTQHDSEFSVSCLIPNL